MSSRLQIGVSQKRHLNVSNETLSDSPINILKNSQIMWKLYFVLNTDVKSNEIQKSQWKKAFDLYR